MHMCISCGYKSYGFLWKYISKENYNKSILKLSKKVNGSPVYIIKLNSKYDEKLFASIAEASRYSGLSEKVIRNIINKNKPSVNSMIFRKYNPNLRTEKFDDWKSLRDYYGVSEYTAKKWLKTEKIINNTIIKLKDDNESI